jgi:hypothetical protein
MSAWKELLVCVQSKVAEQTSAGDDKEAKAVAKAALQVALNDLFLLVATTPKQDMPAAVREELDNALLADAAGLKWILINALKNTAHYRTFLGLPQTMEQTRRFITNITPKKAIEVFDEELGADLGRCEDIQVLGYVDQVLVFLSGAGRFKKELGGFEMKGAIKQAVKKATNQAAKRRQQVVAANSVKLESSDVKSKQPEIERDCRLDDVERDAARASGMESLFDHALALNAKK